MKVPQADRDSRVIVHTGAAVRPVTSEISSASSRDTEEDYELSRAIEASLIDPTERDYLQESPRQAGRRLGRALRELLRATRGLIVAVVAHLVLADSMRAVVQDRGEIPGAELTVRAFECILGGAFYRKVVRQRNVLGMFGATRSKTYEGDTVYGLALARRGYGGYYPGGVEAPRVRATLGVRLMPGTDPVWVERLLEAHRSGKVRIMIGRASDYYGPGGTGSLAGDTLFGAAVASKTVRWPTSLDVPHQFNYLPDIARALVTLGETDGADGEVWHLPAAEPLTGRRFTEMVFAETGNPANAAVFSRNMARLVGIFVPPIREFPEIWYQYDRPFIADTSEFQKTFGPFEPTPHEEAIARTVTWFRNRLDR